jgi:hypothetical protein
MLQVLEKGKFFLNSCEAELKFVWDFMDQYHNSVPNKKKKSIIPHK